MWRTLQRAGPRFISAFLPKTTDQLDEGGVGPNSASGDVFCLLKQPVHKLTRPSPQGEPMHRLCIFISFSALCANAQERSSNVNFYSPEREAAVGAQLAAQVGSQVAVINDDAI